MATQDKTDESTTATEQIDLQIDVAIDFPSFPVKGYCVEDIPKIPENRKPCCSPFHSFPTHLYIPQGQSSTHVCPSCGDRMTVYSPAIQ